MYVYTYIMYVYVYTYIYLCMYIHISEVIFSDYFSHIYIYICIYIYEFTLQAVHICRYGAKLSRIYDSILNMLVKSHSAIKSKKNLL